MRVSGFANVKQTYYRYVALSMIVSQTLRSPNGISVANDDDDDFLQFSLFCCLFIQVCTCVPRVVHMASLYTCYP